MKKCFQSQKDQHASCNAAKERDQVAYNAALRRREATIHRAEKSLVEARTTMHKLVENIIMTQYCHYFHDGLHDTYRDAYDTALFDICTDLGIDTKKILVD